MEDSPSNDHDLLIKLHSEMKGLRADVQRLSDGTGVTIADHETRIRRIEWAGAVAVGMSMALQFYFNYIK